MASSIKPAKRPALDTHHDLIDDLIWNAIHRLL